MAEINIITQPDPVIQSSPVQPDPTLPYPTLPPTETPYPTQTSPSSTIEPAQESTGELMKVIEEMRKEIKALKAANAELAVKGSTENLGEDIETSICSFFGY